MSIQFVNQTLIHCTCVWCGHEWDAFEMPDRCANCKRNSWNGEDKRRRDPLEYVPTGSIVDGKLPKIHVKKTVAALMGAQSIVAQLIADYGPCNHPDNRAATEKEDCVCRETKVLRQINDEINNLNQFAGGESIKVTYVREGRRGSKAKARAKARAKA